MPLELFTPYQTATTAVSVSSSNARGALNVPTGPMAVSVRIYNSTSVVVFIKFGDVSVTAATTDMPIAAGNTETFEISPNVTHVAGITASGTGTLYATVGRGA